jgi:hypothetical protein
MLASTTLNTRFEQPYSRKKVLIKLLVNHFASLLIVVAVLIALRYYKGQSITNLLWLVILLMASRIERLFHNRPIGIIEFNALEYQLHTYQLKFFKGSIHKTANLDNIYLEVRYKDKNLDAREREIKIIYFLKRNNKKELFSISNAKDFYPQKDLTAIVATAKDLLIPITEL